MKVLKLHSYSILKIDLHRVLRDTGTPVIFSGTLFSNLHALASDVRCFELTFEIRLTSPSFDKRAVSVFRVDESEVFKIDENTSDTTLLVPDIFISI